MIKIDKICVVTLTCYDEFYKILIRNYKNIHMNSLFELLDSYDEKEKEIFEL